MNIHQRLRAFHGEDHDNDGSRDRAEAFYAGAQATRDNLREALEKPSCSTCKHGVWSEDRSVGIWLHLEDCEFLPEDFNLEAEYSSDEECYEQTAAKCGHWELDSSKIGPQW